MGNTQILPFEGFMLKDTCLASLHMNAVNTKNHSYKKIGLTKQVHACYVYRDKNTLILYMMNFKWAFSKSIILSYFLKFISQGPVDIQKLYYTHFCTEHMVEEHREHHCTILLFK